MKISNVVALTYFIDMTIALDCTLYVAVWRHNVKGRKYFFIIVFSYFVELVISIIEEV